MTPGSITLWEAATGSRFTCDTLYDDPHFDSRGVKEQDPATYCASLNMLQTLPVKTIYPGHFARFNRKRMNEVIAKITR